MVGEGWEGGEVAAQCRKRAGDGNHKVNVDFLIFFFSLSFCPSQEKPAGATLSICPPVD